METSMKFCDETELYIFNPSHRDRLIALGFPDIEKINWIYAFDFMEKKYGLYGEFLVDAWGDDNRVGYWNDSEDGPFAPCWRAFVWEIGQPKPGPGDDLGCHPKRSVINSDVLEMMLFIAEKREGIQSPDLWKDQ